MANKKDLATGLIGTALTTSATTLVLQSGYGAGMPSAPFFLTLTPAGQLSTLGNSEIVSVTARTGDSLTIVRAQKSTTARAFAVGDVVANGVYTQDIFDTAPKTYFGEIIGNSPEYSDSTGDWVDLTNIAQTFTTEGMSTLKISGFAQARNSTGGTAGTHMRILVDGVPRGVLGRADSPTASSITTIAVGTSILNVTAGSHTVKLQICRSEIAGGAGTGTATVRNYSLYVDVYRTA